MDPEGIILSKISQMEKDKNWIISLICGMENKKETNKTETKSVKTTDW